MCGVAGMTGCADESSVHQMLRLEAHRGPDDSGCFVDRAGQAVLGHRRLAIIDLSAAAHQPMSYAGGRLWMTFNGEIYNFRELRVQLEGSGATFFTDSDSEVVLAAYDKWGPACVRHLRGMFAFAIWDRGARTLFLARDRMGIKPLLYASSGGRLVFASEMKAMLASGLVAPVLDPEALFDYLAFGSVAQPRTFIREVQFLEPGTTLLVQADGSRRFERYWDLRDAGSEQRAAYARLPFTELVAITRTRLEDACRHHLVSDVPVGSFLSGGVDSTAITALMAQYASYPINTFTVGFEATTECRDELSSAREVARSLGCDHTDVVLTGTDVAAAFDRLVEGIDQPSQDGTNSFFVSRAAASAVKVTLSGLGGDELFAGYDHFRHLESAQERPAGFVDRLLSRAHSMRPNRLTLVSALRSKPMVARYAGLRRILPDDALAAALSAGLRNRLRAGFVERRLQPLIDHGGDSLLQTSLVECQGYLKDTLLRDNDVMSMAHSLEVRPVLLDHLLVEHALALPPSAKIRGGVAKAVLIEAVRDLVPAAIMRRPKVGFELPLGTWLAAELRGRVLDCAADPGAQAVFSREFLAAVPAALGDRRRRRELWSFVIFWEWFRKMRCQVPS